MPDAGEGLRRGGQAAGASSATTAPFQNLPGLTDRALLRLGHALATSKQWDASRQAHEQVGRPLPQQPVGPRGPLRHRLGAPEPEASSTRPCNAYTQVTAGTATELAAKAQLQIGLCRLEQKRYADAATALLVVPFTYDYPELSAVALCEAARALAEDKQGDQAIRLLRARHRGLSRQRVGRGREEAARELKKG